MDDAKKVKTPVRGAVAGVLKPDAVKLLETNPDEYIRRTRPKFGFASSKHARDQ